MNPRATAGKTPEGDGRALPSRYTSPEVSPVSEAPPASVVPRDAATIMLVRDVQSSGQDALEVCMLRRHFDSDFVGGAYVFPGGKVDHEDRSAAAEEMCAGRSDIQASAILEVGSGGLAFWVAAIRECFEEAGVLFAYQDRAAHQDRAANEDDVDSNAMVDAGDPAVCRWLAALRVQVNTGGIGFLETCRERGLRLAVDRVHYFSHWITPELAPRRYDTRFFVAALPPGQVPLHDDHETVDTVWVRPAEALERARAGKLDLIFPTIKNLEAIGRFATSVELLRAAAAAKQVPTIVPRVVADRGGFCILVPGDLGYEEAMSSNRTPDSTYPSGSEMGEIMRRIGIDRSSRCR
jgi:8-oxo-dGTP pyrophosphatase MutT (NUDIX family)